MTQRSSGPAPIRDNVAALVQHEALARIRRRHISAQSGTIEAGTIDATPFDVVTGPPAAISAERDELVRNCRIMKGALFNASKRLERKHSAGQFTFALSGMYGFLVPLFTLQFEPFLTALVTYVISFTAATAGAVSFVIAMLYQQQDLASRARRFYETGLKINKLGKDLKIAQLPDLDALRRFMHHYDEILANGENHEEIDYQYATLGARPRINKDGRLDRWIANRRRLDIRFALKTYSLLAAVWLIPPVIGIGTWLLLAK